MPTLPPIVAEFLSANRIAVTGVSRDPRQAANAIFRKLRDSGHDVVAINPSATEVEGVRCYPNVAACPGTIDAVMVASPPAVSLSLVNDCAAHGITRIWFHRSFGQGSVSRDAVEACKARDISCVIGGCPLMFCAPVDPVHRCMRWWLARRGRVPR